MALSLAAARPEQIGRIVLMGAVGVRQDISAGLDAVWGCEPTFENLKEVTLLGQGFVKDDKLSVETLLKQRNARVASFALFVVGEGIEKKQTDFAAEVAAQAAAAAKS